MPRIITQQFTGIITTHIPAIVVLNYRFYKLNWQIHRQCPTYTTLGFIPFFIICEKKEVIMYVNWN